MNNNAPAKENAVRNAATVILVRDTHNPPFEIFLMRRHRKQSFMGGAFVFPGGVYEPDDGMFSREYVSFDKKEIQASLERITAGGISPGIARGLFVTAIRETFEESGILFARRNTGTPESLAFQDLAKWNTYRKQLHNGIKDLTGIARLENIIFAPQALVPYARWITPQIETKRFDTWFFIANLPQHQTPSHDDVELVDSMWVTPKEALLKNDQKKILLMPPTLKTITELAAFSSIEQLFNTLAGKALTPILPQAMVSEKTRGVLLPHDPEYGISDYKQAARPEEPSRIILEDGKWTLGFS